MTDLEELYGVLKTKTAGWIEQKERPLIVPLLQLLKKDRRKYHWSALKGDAKIVLNKGSKTTVGICLFLSEI